MLANCGIIQLKEQGKETKPVILYEQIVLDFPQGGKKLIHQFRLNFR